MAEAFVHPTALVESEQVGKDTRIWAYAHVLAGARVGDCCNIGDHAYVESEAVIGNNVTIKNNVCVWDGVTLKDDVFVGPNAAFTNDLYPRSPRMPQARARYNTTNQWRLETVVERGASIGANATILPGIRVGRYSLIAAGAAVTGDVEPFALMVGAPARQVGYVCRCGRKLAESFRTATCEHCGETPELRCNGTTQ